MRVLRLIVYWIMLEDGRVGVRVLFPLTPDAPPPAAPRPTPARLTLFSVPLSQASLMLSQIDKIQFTVDFFFKKA